MRGSPATIAFYHYTARNFIIWAEQKDGITTPSQININEVRAFLAELGSMTNSDWTLNDNVHGIRTLLRFWRSEGVIPQPITFRMPKVRKKKMLSLNSDELRRLISDCDAPVKKAIFLLLSDSDLRRAFRDCHLMPVVGMHGCRHLSFGTKRDKSGSGTILANLRYTWAT
jgi:site-specific recombinase XerD